MMLLQLADGNQAVNRITGKSADRLCNDEVDFFSEGICYHFIETITALGVTTGNSLIGVDLYKYPIITLADILRVIINLGFVTGELLIAVR